MSTSYTTNAQLQKPANADPYWDVPLNANADYLDGLAAIGALLVTPNEAPSTTLKVRVSAGTYVKADGTVGTYAGVANLTLSASSTTRLWLTDAGVLTTGGSFPTTAHVRLATVVTGTATVTSVADARVASSVMGTGLGFLLKAGDAFVDASAAATFTLGTTHGTLFGATTADLLGFHAATPSAQRSGTARNALGSLTAVTLTDSTGGTAGTTIANVGASFSQSTLNNNFASLAAKVNNAVTDFAAVKVLLNELRAALVAKGLIKGSA